MRTYRAHLQILLIDSSRMRVSMPSSSPGLRRVGGCFASGFSDTCFTCGQQQDVRYASAHPVFFTE